MKFCVVYKTDLGMITLTGQSLVKLLALARRRGKFVMAVAL